MVRPLAFYPLSILVLLLTWRMFKGTLKFQSNRSLVLLGLFLVAAFASTAWGWAFAPIPMHGQEYIGRTLRAWVTLVGGIVFFFSTMLMNQTEDDLRYSLKWLYIGLAVSIVWGGIQMVSYLTGFPDRVDLNKIQTSFSIRKLLIKKRAAGFAYEPSWLANQIVTIYFPWLLAAIFTGYRIFKRQWIEILLFVGMLILLICTFSRGGIVMGFAAGILVFIFTQGKRIASAWQWFIHPFQTGSQSNRTLQVGLRTGIILLFTFAIVGTGLILSTNKYFAQIWRSQKDTLVAYAVDIYAGPRLAYATAGWDVYLDHPITGVGLGASGFYLYDHIPDWAVTTLSEITRQLTPNGWLYPNPKNLYIRLLAETGIVGFILYLLFWLSILGIVIRLFNGDARFNKMLGISGVFIWLVLIFFNFTQDSFIDPNQWLGLGLLLGLSTAFGTKKGTGSQPFPQE